MFPESESRDAARGNRSEWERQHAIEDKLSTEVCLWMEEKTRDANDYMIERPLEILMISWTGPSCIGFIIWEKLGTVVNIVASQWEVGFESAGLGPYEGTQHSMSNNK